MYFMSKKITDQQIKEIAESFGLTYAHLKTFILVESSGSGFNKDGSLSIQFESHLFRRYTGKTIDNKVDVQSKEKIAFKEAFKINPDAAYRATSYGLPQILGNNYKLAGYKSAEEMVKSFQESEYNQVVAMCNFLKNVHPSMMNYIKQENWDRVAFLYNGAAYKKFSYHIKLKNTYEKLSK